MQTENARATQPQYHIQIEPGGADRIQAWSTHHLPFEPRDWRLAFRRALRGAVNLLDAGAGDLLYATYHSPLPTIGDAENLLLYNVGPAAFAAAARHGLRFKRTQGGIPACPVALATPAQHYYHYGVAAVSAALSFWIRQSRVISWEAAPIVGRNAAKCSPVWYPMKQVLAAQSAHPLLTGQPFEVRLTLGVPAGTRPRLAALIKPLLDGVISALHHHNGTDEVALSVRLAPGLQQPAKTIRLLLRAPGGAVLGSRARLHRFGTGVQWNPQDDLCVAAKLRIVSSSQATTWTLTGEVNCLAARQDTTPPG